MSTFYLDREAEEHRYVEEEIDRAPREKEIVLNIVIVVEMAYYLIKNLGPMVGREKLDAFLVYTSS